MKTPGNGRKTSWQLTCAEVLQVWAEAFDMVTGGESLYLDKSMEARAKEEQREALENNECEGVVRDYLDTLLPENWGSLDVYQRRAFLSGTEFGDSPRQGTKKRGSVSNMEIWCACFGRDSTNLRRGDSAEIAGIMKRLEGWTHSDKKARLPLCGPQHLAMRRKYKSVEGWDRGTGIMLRSFFTT